MEKTIYPCFKWPGTIWFYSDPHFSDAHLYEYRGTCINDDEQVRRINSKVGKNDTIVILGDIGDASFIRKLKGYKVLVQGNHDKGASNYSKENLFDEVYCGCVMISDKIMLSHEPVDFKYAFNIHGHDHAGVDFIKYALLDNDSDIPTNQMYKVYLEAIKNYGLKKMNLCAEWCGYYPVALSQIIKSGVLAKIPSIHRDTIDAATSRKIKNN